MKMGFQDTSREKASNIPSMQHFLCINWVIAKFLEDQVSRLQVNRTRHSPWITAASTYSDGFETIFSLASLWVGESWRDRFSRRCSGIFSCQMLLPTEKFAFWRKLCAFSFLLVVWVFWRFSVRSDPLRCSSGFPFCDTRQTHFAHPLVQLPSSWKHMRWLAALIKDIKTIKTNKCEMGYMTNVANANGVVVPTWFVRYYSMRWPVSSVFAALISDVLSSPRFCGLKYIYIKNVIDGKFQRGRSAYVLFTHSSNTASFRRKFVLRVASWSRVRKHHGAVLRAVWLTVCNTFIQRYIALN